MHALDVVTVQEASFFPKRGEFCGKTGFLIINNVFVAYVVMSLSVADAPKTGSKATRYFEELHTQDSNEGDPAGLVKLLKQGRGIVEYIGQ